MERKVALIFGITGQDGSYLAKLLLNKGYIVHGVKRRSSSINTDRIDSIYNNINFKLHYGDITDTNSIYKILFEVNPTEIYNLAAMSHVKVSFELPEYTASVVADGTLKLLEAIKNTGLIDTVRYYQASSSEMYGKVQSIPQNEDTPFYPRSPYAVSKLFGYWITRNYRESYNLFACNGILFNHESPLRGETFVTKKITEAIRNNKFPIKLGNLDAKRDWGHAEDYMEAAWLMLQQYNPDDYVIATGITTTVREFAKLAFREVGIDLVFKNSGKEEIGVNPLTNEVLVIVDENYFRPAEVDLLVGDYSKAKQILGWEPKRNLKQIIKEMIHYDERK